MADFDVKNYAGRRQCCMHDGLLNLQILHIIRKLNSIIVVSFIQKKIFKFLTTLPPSRLYSKHCLFLVTVSGYKLRWRFFWQILLKK